MTPCVRRLSSYLGGVDSEGMVGRRPLMGGRARTCVVRLTASNRSLPGGNRRRYDIRLPSIHANRRASPCASALQPRRVQRRLEIEGLCGIPFPISLSLTGCSKVTTMMSFWTRRTEISQSSAFLFAVMRLVARRIKTGAVFQTGIPQGRSLVATLFIRR